MEPGSEDLRVRISMDEWGDFVLHLAIDEDATAIHLADGCFSFEHFIAWLKTVEGEHRTQAYPIDEEGPDKEIMIAPLRDGGHVRFQVVDLSSSGTACLQGILEKKQCIAAFKKEIRSFFADRFDHEKFRGYINPRGLAVSLMEYFGEEGLTRLYPGGDKALSEIKPLPHLGERILADPWLSE